MFMSAVMVDRHKTESVPVPCLKPNPRPVRLLQGNVPGFTALAAGGRDRYRPIRSSVSIKPAATRAGDLLRVRVPGRRAGRGAEARHSLGLGRIARRASSLRAMPGCAGAPGWSLFPASFE